MKNSLIRITAILFMILSFFPAGAVQAETNGGPPAVQAEAMQAYKEALEGMDMQNIGCDLQMVVNSPLGTLTVADAIKYQKSPFLMKCDINAEFLALTKRAVPLFALTQYMETSDDAMRVYYTAAAGKEEKPQWYVKNIPLDESLRQQPESSGAGENGMLQLQKSIDAVDRIRIESEDENIRRLRIVFDSRKLFGGLDPAGNESRIGAGMPPGDRQKLLGALARVAGALQDSRDIAGTVEIDKSTRRIVSMEFDVSDQLKTVIESLQKDVSAENGTSPVNLPEINGAAPGTGSNAAEIQKLIDNLNASLSVRVEPLADVMQLAVPQVIRDTAKAQTAPAEETGRQHK